MQLIIHLECITDKQLFLYCRQLIKHYSCNTGCLITIILLIAVLKNLVNFIKILLCVQLNEIKTKALPLLTLFTKQNNTSTVCIYYKLLNVI